MKRRRATTMGVNLCGCGASDFDTFFSCSIKRGILAGGASYGRLRFVSRCGGEPVESINRKTEKGFASRYGEPLQGWGFLKALTDLERREKTAGYGASFELRICIFRGLEKLLRMRGLPPPCERAEMDSPSAGVGLPSSSRSSGCPDRGKPYGCGASGCALPKKISARWNPLRGGISGLHPSSILDSHSNKMGKPRRAWLPAIAAFPPCGVAGRPAGKRAGTPILKALWREAPAASTPNIRPPSRRSR